MQTASRNLLGIRNNYYEVLRIPMHQQERLGFYKDSTRKTKTS